MTAAGIDDPKRTSATLSNGLQVVVVELPHLHTCAAQLLVRSGSRYEDPTTAGLSHFMEHMLYRGSKSYPGSFHLNRAIESQGGSLYAETSREVTSYLLDSPPECLDSLLGVLADAIIRPALHDLDVEQKIVLEEILEDLDDDGQLIRVDDVVRRLYWGDHPLGYPITGTRKSVEGFNADLVSQHHRRFYCGSNAVLCIAGPVVAGQLIDRVEHHLGAMPSGERALPAPAPEDSHGPLFDYVNHVESQTSLDLSIRVFPEPDPRSAAQSLLLRVLDDGLSTRLHRRVVDELGLAYNVSTSIEPLEDTALLDFYAACAHESTVVLLQEFIRLMEELAQTPPDVEEFEMARKRVYWDVRSSFDNPRAMTEYYGVSAILSRERCLSERVAQIMDTTPEDVHRVAQDIFQTRRMAAVAVGKLRKTQQRDLRRVLKDRLP